MFGLSVVVSSVTFHFIIFPHFVCFLSFFWARCQCLKALMIYESAAFATLAYVLLTVPACFVWFLFLLFCLFGAAISIRGLGKRNFLKGNQGICMYCAGRPGG